MLHKDNITSVFIVLQINSAFVVEKKCTHNSTFMIFVPSIRPIWNKTTIKSLIPIVRHLCFDHKFVTVKGILQNRTVLNVSYQQYMVVKCLAICVLQRSTCIVIHREFWELYLICLFKCRFCSKCVMMCALTTATWLNLLCP